MQKARNATRIKFDTHTNEHLMRLRPTSLRVSDVREILQHVLDRELELDVAAGVALADQLLEALVLAEELFLHVLPHHLRREHKGF